MPVTIKEANLVLCDRVKREAGTNKATVDGVFDRAFFPKLPGGLNCTLFLKLAGEAASSGQVPLSVSLVRPNGVADQFPPLIVTMQHDRAESDLNFQGLPILDYGEHRFEVRHGGNIIAKVSFNALEIPHGRPPN